MKGVCHHLLSAVGSHARRSLWVMPDSFTLCLQADALAMIGDGGEDMERVFGDADPDLVTLVEAADALDDGDRGAAPGPSST
jgi:hypothetical protein